MYSRRVRKERLSYLGLMSRLGCQKTSIPQVNSLTKTQRRKLPNCLLRHLALNVNRVMLHRELLAEIWGAEYLDDLKRREIITCNASSLTLLLFAITVAIPRRLSGQPPMRGVPSATVDENSGVRSVPP